MKTNRFPFCFFTIPLLLLGCQSPLQDVELAFKKPLPTAARVYVSTVTGRYPDDLKIEVKGPDAYQVTNLFSTTRFRLDRDGSVSFATKTEAQPDQPIRFNVVISAGNFVQIVQPVTLLGGQGRTVRVSLIEKNADPARTLLAQATGQSGGSGAVSQALTMQTPAASVPPTTLTVPTGVQLTDALEQPVSGTLTATAQAVAVNNATAAAQAPNLLPGGGVLSGSKKITTVAGAVRLDLHNAEFEVVKNFSQPVLLVVGLDAKTRNPRTGRAIQPGDAIQVFSYDDAVGRWSQEPDAKISRDDKTGNLVCATTITHLSTWAVGYASELCPGGGVNFGFHTKLPDNYDFSYRIDGFYVEGSQETLFGTYWLPLRNGWGIGPSDKLLVGSRVKMRVYDRNSSAVVESPVVDACEKRTVPLDLTGFKLAPGEVPISVKIKFPCDDLQFEKLPESVTVYFREAGVGNYQSLMTFTKADFRSGLFNKATYRVKRGKRYDFSVSILTYDFEQLNTLIDKAEWSFDLKTKDYCR